MLFVKLFGAVFVELSEHSAASHMVAVQNEVCGAGINAAVLV